MSRLNEGFFKAISNMVKNYMSKTLDASSGALDRAPGKRPVVAPSRSPKSKGPVLDHKANQENLKQWAKVYGDVDPETGYNTHEFAAARYFSAPDEFDKMPHAKSQKELYLPDKPPKYTKPRFKKEKKEIEVPRQSPEKLKLNNPDKFDFTS